ncbi:MAG: hypothetical protein ACR2I1_04030, partial [Propionibacteriaceae bacterium]
MTATAPARTPSSLASTSRPVARLPGSGPPMLARLGGLGNRSTIAALASAGVGVSSRGDPAEQEAARLASQVASVPEADQ